jgi:hypothetical protein
MKTRVALILAALAVSAVVAIVLADRHAPFIPRDIFHTIVISNAACTTWQTSRAESISSAEGRMHGMP